MNITQNDLNAIAALQSIAAKQQAMGVPSEGAALQRFYDERIEHYIGRGLPEAEARVRAREDRVAQF